MIDSLIEEQSEDDEVRQLTMKEHNEAQKALIARFVVRGGTEEAWSGFYADRFRELITDKPGLRQRIIEDFLAHKKIESDALLHELEMDLYDSK